MEKCEICFWKDSCQSKSKDCEFFYNDDLDDQQIEEYYDSIKEENHQTYCEEV